MCRFFHLLPERQFVQQGFEPSNPPLASSEKEHIKVVKNKMTLKSKSSEPSQATASSVSFPQRSQRSKSLNIKSPRARLPGRPGQPGQPHHSTKSTTKKLAKEYFEGIYIGPTEG